MSRPWKLVLLLLLCCLLSLVVFQGLSAEATGTTVNTQLRDARAATSTCSENPADLSPPRVIRRDATRVDLDGDGRKDLVFIAVNRRTQGPCRYVLAARIAGQFLAASIVQWQLAAEDVSLGLPLIYGFTAINRESGVQILVQTQTGASSRVVGVFALSGRELVRMKFRPAATDPGDRDTFVVGGAVTHFEAIACPQGSREGRFETIEAFNNATLSAPSAPYTVVRTLFIQKGSVYERQSRAELRMIKKQLDRLFRDGHDCSLSVR